MKIKPRSCELLKASNCVRNLGRKYSSYLKWLPFLVRVCASIIIREICKLSCKQNFMRKKIKIMKKSVKADQLVNNLWPTRGG